MGGCCADRQRKNKAGSRCTTPATEAENQNRNGLLVNVVGAPRKSNLSTGNEHASCWFTSHASNLQILVLMSSEMYGFTYHRF